MGRADNSTPMEGVAFPPRSSKGSTLRRMQSEVQLGSSRTGTSIPSVRPREHAQRSSAGFWNTVLDRPTPAMPNNSFHMGGSGGSGSSSSHIQPSQSFHSSTTTPSGRSLAGRHTGSKRFSMSEHDAFSSTDLDKPHHRQQRPFQCSLCQVAFSQRSHLNQHVRTVHEKVKPHKCPQCDKAFGKKYDLSSHRDAVHANERPHACEFCDKRFAKRSNLTRHREKLHPDSEQKSRR